MPLDPIFAERLRTHRRYLIRTTLASARARVAETLGAAAARARSALRLGRKPAGSADAAGPAATGSGGGTAAGGAAGATAPTARAATPSASASAGGSASTRARAKHRKAALAWDAKELANVGIAGPALRTVEHTVPVDGYPAVRVRLYYPDQAERADGPSPALPASLSFYGGAFRIGGIDYPSTDALFRRRAADARVIVAAVDYALAPENPYPCAVVQGSAALAWLHANAAELGVAPDAIGISGISAGANLAAAVTIANRAGDTIPLRQQLLEVPVLDLSGAHIDFGATRAMGVPSVLAIRELRSVAGTYLPDRRLSRDELASPLRAADHSGLPPAIILTAEYDPLRRHGELYAAALREAGGDASAVQYRGVIHDTPIFAGVLPAARRWHDDVVSALRHLHDTAPPSAPPGS